MSRSSTPQSVLCRKLYGHYGLLAETLLTFASLQVHIFTLLLHLIMPDTLMKFFEVAWPNICIRNASEEGVDVLSYIYAIR